MATHRFVCDECAITVEDSTTKGIHFCPRCSGEMYWDVQVNFQSGYERPVHSDALAIHPDQRAEHEQTFPNIRLDEQNRPVFDNLHDHQAYLDKCGMVKQTQRIRHKVGTERVVWDGV